MKRISAIIIFLLISVAAFTQPVYDTIRISEDLELIKLSDNAYVHVSYASLPGYGRFPSNGVILVNDGQAFLFDTPVTDSLTMKLVAWITGTMKLKISGFVPNHWHHDCMGGLGFLHEQGIESYANQMTIDIASSKGLPVPKHGFADSLQLHLGDKLIFCYYPGAAHSSDNIVVWIPSEKILFAGCMVKSIDANSPGNMADGNREAYPETIGRLLTMFPQAEIVIPGHGMPGGIELIEHTRELINGSM